MEKIYRKLFCNDSLVQTFYQEFELFNPFKITWFPGFIEPRLFWAI